ncbi:reverse transcriptase domain-containing protein [Tanacetum coccineum]
MLTAPIKGEALVMYLVAYEESISAVLLAEREKDFLAKTPSAESKEKEAKETTDEDEEPENMWKLYTDGASSSVSSGAGLMLVSSEENEYTYAHRFKFDTTNNEAEYEALLAGLRIVAARQLVIKQYLEKTREILKGFHSYSMEHVRRDQKKSGCSKQSGFDEILKTGQTSFGGRSRSMVSKIIKLGYYWPLMHNDVKALIQRCEACQIHSSISRKPKQEMTSITSAWPFS